MLTCRELTDFIADYLSGELALETRQRFDEQWQRSLEKGLWKKSYAGSNADEFFAELSMWYFGTHGDLNMEGPKPKNGAAGLKEYDPEGFPSSPGKRS